MKTIYCDNDIIVCIKPAGVLSTDEPGGMPELIRKTIGEKMSPSEGQPVVRTVHRLDSIVSGLMVYALSHAAASGLSNQIEDGTFVKEYLAVLEGKPEKDSDELHDFLYRSQKERKTYAVEHAGKDVQEAALRYRMCGEEEGLSLVRVKLLTGRTHQIRAQFSSRSLPLYGDVKYGSEHKDAKIALWSCHLSFRHPVSGEQMDFSALPPKRVPWTWFDGFSENYAEEDVVLEFKRGRAFSDCPYAYACDGCAYQGMDYAHQLEKKQKYCAKWLKKYGEIAPIIGMEEPFHYRNKSALTFASGKSGDVLAGVYSRKERRFVRIPNCRMNHEKIEDISASLCELLKKYQMQPYAAQTKKGWLKQAVIRRSEMNGSVMVTLETVSEEIKGLKEFAAELSILHPEVKTIVLDVGKKLKTISGQGFVIDELCGRKFQLSSGSYFPVNPGQGAKLYETAVTFAAPGGEERVLDLGCGNGILGILLAARVKRVIGVDARKDAIREAEVNAQMNGAENIRFHCAAPEEYADALVRSREKFDLVALDSLRGRVTKECVEAASRLKPEKIVYISGNPEMLSKDLEIFMKAKYRVSRMQSFDSLPYTEYAEACVLLTKS